MARQIPEWYNEAFDKKKAEALANLDNKEKNAAMGLKIAGYRNDSQNAAQLRMQGGLQNPGGAEFAPLFGRIAKGYQDQDRMRENLANFKNQDGFNLDLYRQKDDQGKFIEGSEDHQAIADDAERWRLENLTPEDAEEIQRQDRRNETTWGNLGHLATLSNDLVTTGGIGGFIGGELFGNAAFGESPAVTEAKKAGLMADAQNDWARKAIIESGKSVAGDMNLQARGTAGSMTDAAIASANAYEAGMQNIGMSGIEGSQNMERNLQYGKSRADAELDLQQKIQGEEAEKFSGSLVNSFDQLSRRKGELMSNASSAWIENNAEQRTAHSAAVGEAEYAAQPGPNDAAAIFTAAASVGNESEIVEEKTPADLIEKYGMQPAGNQGVPAGNQGVPAGNQGVPAGNLPAGTPPSAAPPPSADGGGDMMKAGSAAFNEIGAWLDEHNAEKDAAGRTIGWQAYLKGKDADINGRKVPAADINKWVKQNWYNWQRRKK